MSFKFGDVVRIKKTGSGGYTVKGTGSSGAPGKDYFVIIDATRTYKLHVPEDDIELDSMPVSVNTTQETKDRATYPSKDTNSRDKNFSPSTCRPPQTSFGALPQGWQYSIPQVFTESIQSSMTSSWEDDQKALKEKRKLEGRCQECGDLLPMSVHGLLDCPKHPKPLPPNHKQ